MDSSLQHQSNYNKKKVHIEVDLLNRHRRLKDKLYDLKVRTKQREISENQRVPRINSKSKKIAESLRKDGVYNSDKLQKTQEILKNSRFMPKKVKTSLYELSLVKSKSPILSKSNSQSNNISVISHSSSSPKFYPSLVRPTKENKELLPNDISLRNELLFNLREEANSRGFQQEHEEPMLPKSRIHTRSAQWLLKKQEKIDLAKRIQESSSLLGCTFKPSLGTTKLNLSSFKASRTNSVKSSQSYQGLNSKSKGLTRNWSYTNGKNNYLGLSRRETSAITSPRIRDSSEFVLSPYNQITPIKMSIRYLHGFSNRLRSKAQVMIDYHKVNLKS